jgi:hypothetical protein
MSLIASVAWSPIGMIALHRTILAIGMPCQTSSFGQIGGNSSKVPDVAQAVPPLDQWRGCLGEHG